MALITAFLTAFYMFRLLFLTFFGKAKDTKIHPHESPLVMTLPLIILALFSTFLGFIGSPSTNNFYSHFVYSHPEALEPNYFVLFSSVGVALLGIFLATGFYLLSPNTPSALAQKYNRIYLLVLNKYWIDEIYNKFIIQPFLRLTRLAFSFDFWVVDGWVNLTATLVVILSKIKGLIDQYIIDGIVNLIGATVRGLGLGLRRLQTGFIQNYLLFIFVGIVLIILLKLIK
jgi:NADH-quinone oxidoreductase subunit L